MFPLTVVAIESGGYTKARFLENEEKLYHWLSENKKFEKAELTQSIGMDLFTWDSGKKKPEIHLPIQKKQNPKKNQRQVMKLYLSVLTPILTMSLSVSPSI